MKFLVAVDGSELALEGVRYVLRLREAGLEAEIVLATVQEPTFLYEMVLPPHRGRARARQWCGRPSGLGGC